MKRALLITLVILFSTSIAKADSNYEDGFSVLNKDYWLVYNHGGSNGPYPEAYQLATIQNGVLVLAVNDTDRGPELISKAYPITSNSVVTVSWRLKAHYANEYFAGATTFYLVDYSTNYDPTMGDSIRPFEYWDESTQSKKYNTVATVYYRNYFYGNQSPPYRGNNFGFCARGGDCFTTDPAWDEFVEFKVEIDFKNKKAKYWQDGQLIGEASLDYSDLDLNKFKYLKIHFSPYGWWTGHSIQIDWFRLSIQDSSGSSVATSCERCLPVFDTSTNELEIPALVIGSTALSVNLSLQSIVPVVALRLKSYDNSTCSAEIIQQCSDCMPSFDTESYRLHIPYMAVGQDGYMLDLSLLSVMPTVDFKLDSFDNSTCSPSSASSLGSGTSGNGGAECSGCSCASYAESHPDECGRNGNLNFRITWHDENDVDLRVIYDGEDGSHEEIDFSNTPGEITGGELDVDANGGCFSSTDTPVENIVYDNPQPGTYTVKVCGFLHCSGAAQSSSVLVQILRDGQVMDQKTVTISDWDSCVTAYTYIIPADGTSTGSSSTGSASASSGIKEGTLNTQGEFCVSFVRDEFSKSFLNDYDLSIEPWCIDGVALCGNYVSVGDVPLSSDITIPSSGYLSDEAGFDDCEEIDISKTYVNKNRDGSYTAFRIKDHQKLGNCSHSITFDYIMLGK